LSEYVSEDVAREILSWEGKVNLDGENKRTAIFFSDIEWFTSISEKFTPEVLVWFLREYLSQMSNIILDEKGFINKYEWDAIMALWWVFWTDENASYHACLSSIKQQRLLKTLNRDWTERGFSEIKVRIWLHVWEAIIWNIWSEGRKMEFTALWDNVNLASRMEWVNKFYGTYICVSEDIYGEVKNSFEFRYLDKIRVKWKEIWVNIYELLEEKWNITDIQKNMFIEFEKGIDLYLKRDFHWALEIFNILEASWDRPSTTYKTRCEMYIQNPPDENWDQIWTMESK
jgi:adenylate cyclase